MNYSLSENYSTTGYLKSLDQTGLFYRYYAVDNQKACIILVHGFGEHSGRYAHVIDRLRAEHFAVLCIDFRGHGHSHGRRGDIELFAQYEEDLKAALKFAQTKLAKKQKLFIVAHSMGALVSLRLASKLSNAIDGLVLSSPLFALKTPFLNLKKHAIAVLAKIWPNFRFPSGIHGVQLTSDKGISDAYDADPLVLKNLSVRAVSQIVAGYEEARDIAAKIKQPFFMQVAGRDPVVDPEATKAWFKNIDNPDATIKFYPDFLHEIYNESRKEEAIEDFIAWLNQRA